MLVSSRPSLVLFVWLALLACRSRPNPEQMARAIVAGDLAKVEQFLRDGADPNARDSIDDPPLAVAIGTRKTDIALRLLAAGADPKAVGRDKESMLLYAVSYGDHRVTAVLLDRGVDPNAFSRLGLSMIGIAADDDKLAVLKLLLDRGVHVDAKDRYHVPPLHYAARDGAVKAAMLLLDRGAQINYQVPEQNSPGETALHAAASAGKLEMVKLLVSHGANRTLVDDEGLTAQQQAFKHGHREVAALLAN